MLCRDRCGYCTFAKPPARVRSPYLSPDEVLAIARAGAAAGCHEALFTLGEAPEERYPAARAWLDEHGYTSTVDYLVAMCALVRDETGLLPHANAGALGHDDLARLRPVSASQGMMLESLDPDLACHRGRPGQDAGATAGHLGGGRSAGHPLHHRRARRHRRVACRAGPHPDGHRRRPPRPRPRPGGDRPELPAQAGHGHARPSALSPRRAAVDHRRGPAGPPARGPRPGPAQPLRRPAPAARLRARRLGRGLAGHRRPRQPRAGLARAGRSCAPPPRPPG